MTSHASPIDPKVNNTMPEAEYIICQSCRAKLQAASYGLAKYSHRGRARACHACKAQYLRLARKRRGAKSSIDDSIVRSVRHQNQHVIAQAIHNNNDLTCVGFRLSDFRDYKVVFGPSKTTGLSCICVFTDDGLVLREMAYSGELIGIEEEILNFVRSLDLRLELSVVEAMASKNVIYYL